MHVVVEPFDIPTWRVLKHPWLLSCAIVPRTRRVLKHSRSCKFAQAFLDDLGNDTSDKIKAKGIEFSWQNSQQSSASSEPADKLDVPETVEQMQCKTFQASKLGIKPDAHVAFKKDEEMRLWRIVKIENHVATMVERIEGDDGATQSVPIDELLSDWRVHKGKVTQRIEGWLAGSPHPLECEAWAFERSKSIVTLAMHSVYEKYQGNIHFLELLTNPAIVRVTKTFKAGALKIAIASMKIEKKSSSGSIAIGTVLNCSLWISPQFTPPFNHAGDKNKMPWVVPFWYVPIVTKDGNMEIYYESVTVTDITVKMPVMRNTVELKAGDKVTIMKNTRDALQKAMPEHKGAKRARN